MCVCVCVGRRGPALPGPHGGWEQNRGWVVAGGGDHKVAPGPELPPDLEAGLCAPLAPRRNDPASPMPGPRGRKGTAWGRASPRCRHTGRAAAAGGRLVSPEPSILVQFLTKRLHSSGRGFGAEVGAEAVGGGGRERVHAARGARLLGVQVFLRKVGVRLREPLEVVWKERGAWVNGCGVALGALPGPPHTPGRRGAWGRPGGRRKDRASGVSAAPRSLPPPFGHLGFREAKGRCLGWASVPSRGRGGSPIPGTRLAPQGRRVDGWGRAGPRCTRGWVALRVPEDLRGSAPCVPAGLGPVSGGVHRGLGDAQRPRCGALRRAGDGAASRESLRRAGAHCTARLQRRQRSPCLTFGCSLKTHPNKT